MLKVKDIEIKVNIEKKPMTDGQRRSWSQFWDEIINEARSESKLEAQKEPPYED